MQTRRNVCGVPARVEIEGAVVGGEKNNNGLRSGKFPFLALHCLGFSLADSQANAGQKSVGHKPKHFQKWEFLRTPIMVDATRRSDGAFRARLDSAVSAHQSLQSDAL